MLLEVGFAISIYSGCRAVNYLSKKYKKRNKKNALLTTHSENPDNAFKAQNAKTNYYIKASLINVILGGIKQFIYPGITPLYLVTFSVVSFPLFNRAEQALLQKKQVNMDVLTTVGAIAGLLSSQYFAMGIGALFYHTAEKITIHTQKNSKKLLFNAFEELPDYVYCLKDSAEIEVPLSSIQQGDVIIVAAGQIIPIDGVIVEGTASIDQQSLTGESQPAEKSIGDTVFSTTIVLGGKIFIKTQKTGKETTSSHIHEILSDSQSFKNKTQLVGEQWAEKGVIPFLMLFFITAPILGVTAGLIILTSYFGGRIRVLAPLGTLSYLKLASQQKILVKKGQALEKITEIDTVLFDKTGTLTDATLFVSSVISCSSYTEDQILIYAAAAEVKMKHPIAQAIIHHTKQLKLPIIEVNSADYHIGYGINVVIEDLSIQVGSARFIENQAIIIPDSIQNFMADSHEKGYSMIMVSANNVMIGAIELQSKIRPEAYSLIKKLKQRGIKNIAVVSGDHEKPTKNLAQALAMNECFYNVLPEDKAAIVSGLQAQGKKVCFIGDGINDAIAMQQADVAISFTSASSIATNVSDIVLLDDSLGRIDDLFHLATQLDKNLKKSLAISLFPTVINLYGVYFYHLGYLTAIIIKNIAFFIGIGNALSPLENPYLALTQEEVKHDVTS